MSKTAIVNGAGLAGPLMALLLAKRGYSVSLYEKREDPRKADFGGGRSINLALSVRGIHALEQAGLAEKVLKEVIPMRGRLIHTLEGATSLQPYSIKPDEYINSVSRHGLNCMLLDAAEEGGVRCFFQHDCIGFTKGSGELQFDTNGTTVTAQADLVVGADGAGSPLRKSMEQYGIDSTMTPLGSSYKELTIPPADGGGWRIEKNALHIWPRGAFMLIALPNLDGSFTVTLFLADEGKPSFAGLTDADSVNAFFSEYFPDAVQHMPTLVEDFFGNPTGFLGTLKCGPWHVDDKAIILGDAAHAVVPFYGQGMNASFEDCVILAEGLDKFDNNAEVFDWYFSARKADADAIADLAVDNFVEMRDHTANPVFIRKRKIETALEQQYEGFRSKYSMVTFSRVPYGEAKSKGEAQDKVLMDLCADTDPTLDTAKEKLGL